ncbi:hypothetical protein PIB30_064711 [Stylosanthes scabra]|uniref:Cytochrome P450 71A1 n=1 Tax=Stylosanthes scabra TaxID=79078 RepID=A0ABU6SM46_9FABA|nr:hypothetical protein [Stylosanthes scabra]
MALVLKQFPYTLYLSILVGIISILLLVLNHLIVTRRRKSISLPPSPPKLPFIGNLHQLGTLPHRSLHELSKKHGPFISLQLGQIPTLVISSADTAKEIIKYHDVIFANRPHNTAAKIFGYGYKDIAFLPYGKEWRQKRKICILELLSLKRVKSFHTIMEEEVAELVHNIHESCLTSKDSSSSCMINLSEMIIATSNDIVSRCVLGQKCHALEYGSSNFGELARTIMKQLNAFCVGDFFPSLHWIDVLTGFMSKVNHSFVALDACLEVVIEEHKGRKKNHDDHSENNNKDFVDILLQIQHNNMLEIELTQDDIKAILADMFIGGSDTTSTVVEWTFAELLKNPNTMKKAQEEVRRVVGSKSKVDENDVNQMNYLHCVIKETLRLHPPAPLLLPRETTSNVKVKGYDIPPKTRLFINVWSIQRDPELWIDPENFTPERFENTKVDIKGQDFQLMPFGSGRRGCPGISFGFASAKFILANLLYWFDWKLPPNYAGDGMDMSEIYGVTVNKKVPLHLTPIPIYSSRF